MKFLRLKHNILISCIMMLTMCSSHAIQKTTANVITGIFAAASALGNYKLWSVAKNELHPAIFSAATVLMGLSGYYYLHTLTPEGILKSADNYLDEIMNHRLARCSFKNDKMLFNAVYDMYMANDLPLISAYYHLIDLLPVMHHVFDLLDKASLEISEDTPIEEKYEFLLLRATKIFNNISDAIKRIRSHKSYLLQLQVYKEFLAQDKHIRTSGHSQQTFFSLKWFKKLFG